MTDDAKPGGKAKPFAPGRSGNPNGRPKGVPDRRNQWRESLADELPTLMAALKKRAAKGDDFAIRLILERVAPPLRPQGPTIELPELGAAENLAAKAAAIVNAIAAGRVPVDIGRGLIDALASMARVVEIDDLARRVESLERMKGEAK